MNKLLITLIAILIWIFIISIYGFYIAVHPRKYVSNITPSSFRLDYENVTFKTRDNIKLKGWFIPSKKTNKTIIIAHGYPFDKGNVLGYAEFLHKNYSLLFFDFRAMGESEGKFTSVGYCEKEDLLAAIKYLKNRGIKDIAAIGFSLGAAVILMTNSPDIKAIVADSSYANIDMMVKAMYRQFFIFKYPFVYLTKLIAKLFLGIDTSKVSPLKEIKKIKVPVLLIHGEKDSQINVKNSILLHEANPKTQLWIVKNADHGEAHAIVKEEYEDKILKFFNKHFSKNN